MQDQASVIWEEATDRRAREEIYRFRYTQYFSSRDDLPGTDHMARRVWLPQDDSSRHLLARNPEGEVIAIGTITPADHPSLDSEWREVFDTARLAALLPHTVVISRVIVAENARHSLLFGQLCLRVATAATEAGFHYAVHYCAPGMVFLYERLGYRQYGHGRNLHAGAFRVPMFLAVDDTEYLKKLHSPLCALGRDPEENRVWLTMAYRACPELLNLPLHAEPPRVFSDADLTRRLRELCPDLPEPSPLSPRAARRGAVIPLREGDILAREGVDEGVFLVLNGTMRCGGERRTPGATLRTGGGAVMAESDAHVLSATPDRIRSLP